MNITNVPKIEGPNYGGVIYGLSVDLNYSEEPSVLTLEIVSENGLFTISPSNLNSLVTVRAGNFTFIGYVWEYEISRNATQSTLKVQIIDGSVILDRHYVVLWRPGMFNLGGSQKLVKKTFKFSDESALLPFWNSKKELVEFKEIALKPVDLDIPVRSFGGKQGGAILVGTEQFPSSPCDLGTTDYSFGELSSASPISIAGAVGIDKNYRATYTGNLRSVLNSWCELFGVSFYWDYSSNSIKFYDTLRGISYTKQNINDPKVISNREKASKRGTFSQYLVSWAAKPKEPIKTKTASYGYQIGSKFNPYNLGWLISRGSSKQKDHNKFQETFGKYGPGKTNDTGKTTKRTLSDFVESALLSQYSKELRYIYNLEQKNLALLGIYLLGKLEGDAKKKAIGHLEVSEFAVDGLFSIGGSNLENFDMYLGWFDEQALKFWETLELEYIKFYGKYYPIGMGGGGTFQYCSSTVSATITTSVSTQGQKNEELSDIFGARRIFDRGGAGFVPAEGTFREELNLDDNTNQESIDAAMPTVLELENSDLIDTFVKDQIIKSSQTKNLSLIIIPGSKLLKKIGLRVSGGTGINPTESTIADVIQTNANKPKCKTLEERRKNSCQQYEDKAREMSEKAAAQGSLKEQSEEELTDGLSFPAKAKKVRVSAFGGSVELYTPSDAQYQVVGDYQIEYETVSKFTQTLTTFFTEGSIGTADGAEAIDVIMHNATDGEDAFGAPQKTPRTVGRSVKFNTHVDEQTITYVGIPNIPLSPNQGLKSLNMSLNNQDGFTTTVTYADHPPRRSRAEDFVENVESRLRRNSFNGA